MRVHLRFLAWFLALALSAAGSLSLAKERSHTVNSGDSIARIADFYGVGQRDLRDLNGLRDGQSLRPGQVLRIPDSFRGGASKGHKVKQGDTLAAIARKYRVPKNQLIAANKLGKNARLKIGRTLVIPDKSDGGTGRDGASTGKKRKKASKLKKSGVKVKGGVRHTVQPGQSLWIIARAYNTEGSAIAKANGFEVGAPLRAGQKILVPGARNVVPVRVKGFNTQKVRFVSVWNNKSAEIRLISKSGRINQRSRRILSKLAGPKKKRVRRVKLLHPRLIHMLQRVAERFPGNTIDIISGYRPHKRGKTKSKHSEGRAVDFRVRGVPRDELYAFIKELPRVGAGYYPNSVFVHLDVRKKKILWTDYSGVGERAQMTEPGAQNLEARADAQTGD